MVEKKQWFGCHDGWMAQFWLKNQNLPSGRFHKPQYPNQTAARLTAHGSSYPPSKIIHGVYQVNWDG
jgi:hypothetical protein